MMIRLKRILPRVDAHVTGEVTVADTPEIARDLTWVLERWPMAIEPAVLRHLHDREAHYLESRDTVTRILAGYRPPNDLRELAEPARDYQVAATEIILIQGFLVLSDDLGAGKTLSALAVMRDPRALPAVFVSLTALPRQMLKAMNRFLPWLTGHIVDSTKVYDPRTRPGIDRHPDVLFIPYSKLANWAPYLMTFVKYVVFDEVQELRRRGTHKYMAAEQVALAADYAVGLSATPIYNYGGEIFNIVNVVAPGRLGTWDEFRREWCDNDGSDATKVKVKHPAALGAYLRDEGIMLRRTLEEVGIPTPGLRREVVPVDIDEEPLQELEQDDLFIRAAQMIAGSGGSRDQRRDAAKEIDWRLRLATGVAKAPFVAAAVRILLEAGEPVLLFGWHHDVYDIWREKLGDYNPVFYTGQQTVPQKQRSVDAFLRGDTNLMIMSLRSGAGLDGLQERCSIVCVGELDWAAGVHDQGIGRADRPGQANEVLAIFFVSDSGADPVMVETLNLKRQQSDPIVDPDVKILAPVEAPENRMRDLARDFLKRRAT